MQVPNLEQTSRRRQRPLRVGLATSPAEIEAAQRLRHRVFAGELGARMATREPGLDRDIFDPWCEHLVVRDDATGEVVGTYRMLTAERARRLGTFYSETEFDLTRLGVMRARMCEVGRACIHPDYRTGAAIMMLWQGLAEFVKARGCDYVIGCASIGMADGGANALRIFHGLDPEQLAPIEYRVFPRHPLVAGEEAIARSNRPDVRAAMPPLVKGYLRLGAWVCGEPAWDPDFNTADLFLFLPLARLERRYARHYLKAA